MTESEWSIAQRARWKQFAGALREEAMGTRLVAGLALERGNHDLAAYLEQAAAAAEHRAGALESMLDAASQSN